jgi:hypothetical protein
MSHSVTGMRAPVYKQFFSWTSSPVLLRKYLLGAISFGLFFITGCSNQALSETMQADRALACERMSEGQAREDCLRGYQKAYDQYKRERNEVSGNKQHQAPKLEVQSEKSKDESNN